jgi:putative ATP-dependent DNA ligase
MAELPGFIKKFLPEQALESIRLDPYEWAGRSFVRVVQDFRGLPRGTVFWEGGLVHGYPRIRRILHLARGIRRYLKGSFHIEEKVDGYNVRVCRMGGGHLAFTRGGFVCPVTTDRLPDLLDLGFFDRRPDFVLCGEVAGPENPYNTEAVPYIDKDMRFFAFDLMDGEGRHMPSEERYGLLGEAAVPQVRHWGPFGPADVEEIKTLVLGLDRDGREGIVLKPSGPSEFRKKTLKYVTLSSCLRDIEASSALMAELPSGFYIQRIMRAAYFSHEFGVPLGDDYLLAAAKALYLPNVRLLQQMEKDGEIRESFRVRVRDREAVEALMHHLQRGGVKAHLTSVEPSDGRQTARFYKVYQKGTKDLRKKLKGYGFFD